MSSIARVTSAFSNFTHQDACASSYFRLTPAQRGLLGPKGEQVYAQLSIKQRGVFDLLSERMEKAGLDLKGLRLEKPIESIRPNRLHFVGHPMVMARLRQSIEAAIQKGIFQPDNVFGPFHPGRADFGAREKRGHWSIQIGIGNGGAFVDMDRFNPWLGVRQLLGHTYEVLMPGKPGACHVLTEIGEG